MIPTEILERVARGAELLDRVKPDWFEVVTGGTLRMCQGWISPGNHCGCVLALNYGGYSAGLTALRISRNHDAAAADLGFKASRFLDYETYFGDYAALDAAWLEEADRRRAAKQ